MKIAFVGKGGSGKTTTSALFGRWLARAGHTVLAFDGDVNQHLFEALGATQSQNNSLTTHLQTIKEYVRGTNTRIRAVDHIIKTTPPGTGSRLMRVSPDDPLLKQIMTNVNGVWAAAAGELEQNDLGVKCFHGKSGIIELLLGHIIDGPSQYALVDLTAGADPFASSILAKVDAVVLVVEPNLPSLGVYEQFKKYHQPWVPPLFVLGNKVADADDAAWLQQKVGEHLLASLPVSDFVKRQGRGVHSPITQLEPEVTTAFEALLAKLSKLPRDWQAYQDRAYLLHQKTAESWASKSVGADVLGQIDPEFSYARAAAELLR